MQNKWHPSIIISTSQSAIYINEGEGGGKRGEKEKRKKKKGERKKEKRKQKTENRKQIVRKTKVRTSTSSSSNGGMVWRGSRPHTHDITAIRVQLICTKIFPPCLSGNLFSLIFLFFSFFLLNVYAGWSMCFTLVRDDNPQISSTMRAFNNNVIAHLSFATTMLVPNTAPSAIRLCASHCTGVAWRHGEAQVT